VVLPMPAAIGRMSDIRLFASACGSPASRRSVAPGNRSAPTHGRLNVRQGLCCARADHLRCGERWRDDPQGLGLRRKYSHGMRELYEAADIASPSVRKG
jgi:hypothetical protein